ncbi:MULTISPECIES: response regulator [unclassified Spirosoma]|uniref:response regulator n=1 Tax=unclassified Spirosoma TaxID=2621999 RepID=UPI000966AE2E|nr:MULTISPECIES: response regulator [unclassified Spirosoma]MBN8820471.1 response regulator [Spirosoma sp.]OJW72668.1 MAG: hypothetical protein BGO59_16260 [Spirosoma sp. 48-14]
MITYQQPIGPRFPILLLEDDQSVIDIIQEASKTAFPEADFIVIKTFEDAIAFLDNLEGKGAKLVLLDIHLSGTQTGLDLLERIKVSPRYKLLPAIIFTMSDNQTYISRAYQLGANSFINKPFSFLEWKNLLLTIRLFWYKTATLPNIYF